MNAPLTRALLLSAESVSLEAHRGVRRLFQQTGGSLSDFIDSQPDESTAVDVAVAIFAYFCIEDGKFNRFLYGVQLALNFLDRTMASPTSEREKTQAFRDLHAILTTGYSQQAIRGWIEANYT